jgi:hypothetical protein
MVTAQHKSRHQVMMAASSGSGEGGIRTLGPVSRTQHFQCCTIGRSATSPVFGSRSVPIALHEPCCAEAG